MTNNRHKKWLLLSVPPSPHTHTHPPHRPQPLTEAIINWAKTQTCEHMELHVWLPHPLKKNHCLWPWARYAQSVTSAAITFNIGVISSSWHAYHIIWLKQEKDKMLGRKRFWLSTSVCRQTPVLGPSHRLVHLCVDSPWLCACLQHAQQCVLFVCMLVWVCVWVICCYRVIPQVSDIWSPGLIGPRRVWHSAGSIMLQAHPIRLWSPSV